MTRSSSAPARDVSPAVIAERFDLNGDVESVRPQAGGHINSSYVVTTTGGARRFLLQRVNTTVFTRPDIVMDNLVAVTDHLFGHLAGSTDQERRALRLVRTRAGDNWLRDDWLRDDVLRDGEGGHPWRCFEFIENSICLLEPRDANDAREAAVACGRFLTHMAEYDGPRLADSLPRFHDTPHRFEQLAGAVEQTTDERRASAEASIDFALARRAGAGSITSALAAGALPERIAHNDAKISNVLFDDATRRALCVIDLDTVMPTSSLYDFGDLVRSMASGRPEDETDLDAIDVGREVFVALVDGFLDGFGATIEPLERALLVEGARIMTLQQGVRFLADHLAGDIYFRVEREGQNLDRARAQLRLVERIEGRRRELEAIVAAR